MAALSTMAERSVTRSIQEIVHVENPRSPGQGRQLREFACSGVSYYGAANESALGLMHAEIGGRAVSDIEFVLAYDIDRRKVGQDLSQAIFAKPNCTAVFCADVPATGAVVKMGKVLDGVAGHMEQGPVDRAFQRCQDASAEQGPGGWWRP